MVRPFGPYMDGFYPPYYGGYGHYPYGYHHHHWHGGYDGYPHFPYGMPYGHYPFSPYGFPHYGGIEHEGHSAPPSMRGKGVARISEQTNVHGRPVHPLMLGGLFEIP